jgi:hypothetical protein
MVAFAATALTLVNAKLSSVQVQLASFLAVSPTEHR